MLFLSVSFSFAQNKPTHLLAPYQISIQDATYKPDNTLHVAGYNLFSVMGYVSADFEDPTFPPAGWTIEFTGTTSYWTRETTCSGYGIGTAAARFNFYSALTGVEQSLITKTFAAAVAGDSVKFDHAYATYTGNQDDQLELSYSTDNGATYTLLHLLHGGDTGELATAPGQSGIFVPTASQWATKTYALPLGTNKIRFKAISAFGNNMFIDNIKVGTAPANDVGMATIDFSVNQQPGVVVPKATVKNFGSATQASFNVTMHIGAYTSTKSVTSLAPGATSQVTFDNWNATLGAYNLKVYTQLAGDADATNDTLNAVISVSQSGWMAGADINIPTYMGSGCATMFNGSALMFSIGGNTPSALNTEVNKYDLAANTWTAMAPLPVKRVVMTSAALAGKVFVFGGSDGSSYQTSVFEYDIATNAWSNAANLPGVLGWAKAYPYQDSLVYLVGGYDGANYLTQVLLYNLNTNTFRAATGIPVGTFGGALAITGNKIVYVGGATVGGIVATTFVGTIDATDRSLITWETKASYPVGTRFRWDGGSWNDGIIVAGGSSSATWSGSTECYVYKPATDTWIPMPNRTGLILGSSVGALTLANGGLRYIMASGYDGSAAVTSTQIFFDDSFTPVELTSFTGTANENNVVLNWSTATETNNSGFYVEKKSGSNFINLGFISGKGTTTQVSSYSYTDRELTAGTYTYRLKQVDFNGTVSYSPEINVDMNTISTFNLSQNYPNPFNPSTAIKFSIAVDSKVTLKVFNLLGQEVFSNIQDMKSGYHTVNFNGSSLSSGVYFYRLEAKGSNGADFTAVKKMTLIK